MRAIRLLPIIFLFVGGMTYLDRCINGELSRLSHIRSQFLNAINETKSRLSHLAWNAALDTQIHQLLEAGQSSNLGPYLQNYLRLGEVSQFDVIDESCGLVARVPQNSKPVTDLCQLIKAKGPAIVWQQSELSDPSLVFIVPRDVAGKRVFFAAQVVLDHAWFSLYPDIASLVANRDVSFAPHADGALLWNEGRFVEQESGQIKFAVPLKVDGFIYRLIPSVSGISLNPFKESFWVLYGALGVVILIAMWQESNQFRQDEKERKIFVDWVQDHHSKKSKTILKMEGKDAPGWSEIVSQAKTIVADRDEQRSHQLRLAKDRVDLMAARLREKDAEIAQLENKVAGMSDLASLQEQLQHTTSSFLKQMEQMREVCENFYDVMTSGISNHAKNLRAFCARWKEGVSAGTNREIAARKFFRSLVETKGSIPGFTKLDDDMREFEQLTSQTLDQSIHAAFLARQVVDGCESAAKLAALWNSIALRDSSQKTSEWTQCLSSAQKLVAADERFQTLTFESLPRLGNPEEMYPAVASAAMISGFFHLYLALLQDLDVKSISMPIVVRQKRFKEQASIILSLPTKRNGMLMETPSRKMLHHVDLAKQILSGCGVKVSVLPQTIAGFPVGLTWSIPQKHLNISLVPVDTNSAESSI